MVFVFSLLLLVFRNISPVILPFVSIALGVAFAIAVTQVLFGAIQILTIVFGASLIGVVIDYSLHYFYHKSHVDNADTHHSRLLGALFLSLCTSLVGYAALSFSSLITLQKVAIFSCCGLLMAWLTVVCLGDLMTKNIKTPRESLLEKLVLKLRQTLRLFPQRIIIALFLWMIIAAGLILSIAAPVSDDPRLFFNASPNLLAQERKVGLTVNDFEPGRYLLVKGSENRSLQKTISLFRSKIAKSSHLEQIQFVNLVDWVPDQKQQQDNYALQEKLFSENGALRLLNNKLGITNSPQDNFQKLYEDYLNAKGKHLDIAATAQALAEVLPPLWLEYKHQELAFILIRKGTDFQALEELTSSLKNIEYINTLSATTEVLSEQRYSASWLLFIAYFLISLLLLCRFKKIAALWMLAVPIFSSSLIVIIFFITGNTLNLFHIMALFLVLGLGMDYSIFVKEMRDKLSITHHSIFLSAITSLLSFGLLAVSSIPVVSAFGLTLLIGNLSNLFASFIFSEQLSRYEQ